MKIKRDDALRELELVQHGVAPRETVDFSRAFIFQNNTVLTYDDVVMCRIKSSFKGIKGAVEAQGLLDLLRDVAEPELELEQQNGRVLMHGTRKKYWFDVEKLDGRDMPADQVETPERWRKLPDGFGEALALVQECAKDKDATATRTYVHITPTYMEAYDNQQTIRYHLEMKRLKSNVLLRRTSVKAITSLGMTEYGETRNWFHLKAPSGLEFACRRWYEDYPTEALGNFFTAKGDRIRLPKELEGMVERLQKCTAQLADANKIKVEVKDKRVYLTGQGVTRGGIEWSDPLEKYRGGEYCFLIRPDLLTNLVKKYAKAELTAEALVVRGPLIDVEGGGQVPQWTYYVSLTNPDEAETETEPAEAVEEVGDEERGGDEDE